MNVQGKRITVFGMANSGRATLALLRQQGATVRASDSRVRAALNPFEGEFIQQSPAALEECDIAVLSPGVAPDQKLFCEAVERGVTLVGDVEAASWFLRGPIIGVTGANGKTTTTALIGHLLETAGIACQVGGNIGRPVAEMVASSRDGQWNVLELSSFQLETTTTMRVQIAAVLNITPDHLDRHHTFENYVAAKARILANQHVDDYAVLNAENPPAAKLAELARGQVHWFNAGAEARPGCWCADDVLLADGEAFLARADIRLRGRHNVENILAAVCCARLAGARLDQIRDGVRTFPGLEHRIEFVRTLNGVDYFNDSKATNVDATVKALESFSGGLWVILGGKDKNSDYTTLIPLLKARAEAVLLIGAAADKIAAHLGNNVPLLHCGDLATAIARAHAEARPGHTVLLAPACASFDQFSGYEERGRVFKRLVGALKESATR